MQNNIIIRNPCDAVILPKKKEKERRVLTIEEQKEVLEHAKGRVCEQQVRVALGTGMRAGELQGLTWDDIDFDKREIHVNKTLVYIRDRESGKYYRQTKIGKDYEPIAHIYPHCRRHTFATRCFEAGIASKTVQNYLGHSLFAITMDLYTHITEDKAHSEMQKLNQLYQMIG